MKVAKYIGREAQERGIHNHTEINVSSMHAGRKAKKLMERKE